MRMPRTKLSYCLGWKIVMVWTHDRCSFPQSVQPPNRYRFGPYIRIGPIGLKDSIVLDEDRLTESEA